MQKKGTESEKITAFKEKRGKRAKEAKKRPKVR